VCPSASAASCEALAWAHWERAFSSPTTLRISSAPCNLQDPYGSGRSTWGGSRPRAWLASDQCSFSTDAVFDISGGRGRPVEPGALGLMGAPANLE
jgi:hypothetical protein